MFRRTVRSIFLSLALLLVSFGAPHATAEITEEVDLHIGIDAPNPIGTGRVATFNVDIHNHGGGITSNTVLTVTLLPSNEITFVTWPTTCVVTGTMLGCEFELGGFEHTDFEFSAGMPSYPTVVTATTVVTDSGDIYNLDNNTAVVVIDVVELLELYLPLVRR